MYARSCNLRSMLWNILYVLLDFTGFARPRSDPCFGIYFMFCLAKCVSTWKMAKALNSIGRNTIVYYPLTGYIPTTIDRFLTALGYNVSSQIYSVLFKLVGFIIAWGVTAVIKLKKQESSR